MRIGIIGGGAAGLATAWLLERDHDVTLFEKDERFGGHAHTVDIEVDGQRIAVDAGFQFFADERGLRDLQPAARRARRAPHVVPGDAHRRRTPTAPRPVVMPPFRRGRPVWPSLTPRAIIRPAALPCVPRPTSRRSSLSTTPRSTIAEYIERKRLPASFVDDFLSRCCSRSGASTSPTSAASPPTTRSTTSAPTSRGDCGRRAERDPRRAARVRRRARRLPRARRRCTPVRPSSRVTRERDGTLEIEAGGVRHPFDHLVFACNAAPGSSRFSRTLPELDELTRAAGAGSSTSTTTIAIHGDRRLMPRDEAAWSVVNARADGAHSSLSIWNPTRGDCGVQELGHVRRARCRSRSTRPRRTSTG